MLCYRRLYSLLYLIQCGLKYRRVIPIMQKLVSSLRSAGMLDSAILAFLSTVFVEIPKAVAETIVNGTK